MDTSEAYKVFEDLAACVLSIDPCDKEAILDVGTKMEKALAGVPEDQHDARTVVMMGLQCLQGIYMGKGNDPDAVMAAMATALGFAANTLSGRVDDDLSADDVIKVFEASFGLECDDAEDACESVEVECADSETVDETLAEQNGVSGEPAEVTRARGFVNAIADDSDPEILTEFIVECLDHIHGAEGALLDLEADPEDPNPIGVVFRAFHTIKGTAGFLGLDMIQLVAHLAENLLDRVTDGEIRCTGGYADLAIRSSDMLKTMISGIDGLSPGDAIEVPEDTYELLGILANPEAAGVSEESQDDTMRIGDIIVAKELASRENVEEVVQRQGDKPIAQALVNEGVIDAADAAKAIRTQRQATENRGPATSSSADASIRVATGRLDSLMNMVGELVIAQSMVSQDTIATAGEHSKLARNVSHAGKIIRELQDLTMSLRMVPLKATFQKMTRLVRDLAKKSGKRIRFVCEGEDTEIDRRMVQVLNDPLIHMIRNSCDHGIEAAEDRGAAGKDAQGNVTLRAYHSAGSVVIELQDDGKGLDRDKILAKATERGLIESGRDLADSELFNLIFNPGFSTAAQVTDVSGRGVGMDVVKKSIDSIQGRIETRSTQGVGTTFVLRLPLTTAIADAMLISVGKQNYLLPTMSIEHSFRPEAGSVSTVGGKGEVVMLRGDLLPVFRLHKMFNVEDAVTTASEALFIVIEGEGKRCVLMVDQLLGQQQVVVKSLGDMIGHIPGVSGGGILGDGRVGLILDAGGLMQLIHDGPAAVDGGVVAACA